MTPRLGNAEANHSPGSIMLGMFTDMGWTVACTFSLSPGSATFGTAATSASVTVTTQPGCQWTASSGNSAIATISQPGPAQTMTGSGTAIYSVSANTGLSQRSVTLTIADLPFTITQAGTGPTVSIDRSALIFSGVSDGSGFVFQTPSQVVRLAQTGNSAASWTASSNAPWVVVSPTSGSGSALLTISAKFAPGLVAT